MQAISQYKNQKSSISFIILHFGVHFKMNEEEPKLTELGFYLINKILILI